MTEPTTLELVAGFFLSYWMVSIPFKMFLVFFWAPEQFVLHDEHPSHDLLMAWIDLVCAFIMVPILPEIYYIYVTLFRRKR